MGCLGQLGFTCWNLLVYLDFFHTWAKLLVIDRYHWASLGIILKAPLAISCLLKFDQITTRIFILWDSWVSLGIISTFWWNLFVFLYFRRLIKLPDGFSKCDMSGISEYHMVSSWWNPFVFLYFRRLIKSLLPLFTIPSQTGAQNRQD